MKSNPLSNWWVLVFNGIIAVLYGLLALFAPAETLTVIVKYFGYIVLIIGVAMLIGAINSYRKQQHYAGDLISSIIAIAIGGVFAFYTAEAVKIFLIIIGVWSVLLGVGQLLLYATIKENTGTKKTLLINGLLTLALGIVMFFTPMQTASIMVFITGFLALIIGIVMISMAIVIKNIAKDLTD